MSKAKQALAHSKKHAQSCHQRWMEKRSRRQESPEYKDEWWSQQCGMCRYFISSTGILADDYGVCSNPLSDFDGLVRFEHDGCDWFSEEEDWGW